jgi:hypothetical protein
MALTHSISITGNKTISGNGFVYEIGKETVTTEPLYIKVVGISGNKLNLTATVTFTSQATGTVVATKSYQFPLDLNGDNPIKQTYEYLKTLPEFATATDC